MEELVGEESEDAEHDVQMHLGMTAYPHLPPTKLVLKTGVDPLAYTALAVPARRRRVKGGTSLPRPFLSMMGLWPNSSET